jgi:hypothetical protein
MKTQIHINHIREIEKYKDFPFVVEISAFSDCGISEYWGTDTKENAEKILDDESEKCRNWVKSECPEHDIDTVPANAVIYIRPAPDEDGDFVTLDCWEGEWIM